MSKIINLTGQRFGRLFVVRRHGKARGNITWLCKCGCGKEVVVRGGNLRNGHTKSCGCLSTDLRKLNLLGKKFNRLTVIKEIGITEHKTVEWLCKCDCGNEKVVTGSNLISGHTKSCGCLKIDAASDLNKIHGMSNTRFYNIYKYILQRCNNTNCKPYKNYGGRGIKVCDRWDSFLNFKEDMYKSYLAHVKKFGEKDTTLDRIDVNGNYCKENCRWATRKEQQNNTRFNHFINVNGERLTLAQASEKYGINYVTVVGRINSGKDIFGNKLVEEKLK